MDDVPVVKQRAANNRDESVEFLMFTDSIPNKSCNSPKP